MFNYKGYFDLNIEESCITQNNIKNTVQTLYDFGYRTIAINQHIQDDNIEPKKKKKKGEPRETTDVVPTPYDLQIIEAIIKELGLHDFQVLNRLTVSFSNGEVLHKIIKSPNYKKYHLVAMSPLTMGAFLFTCSTVEADILTFNPENKVGYKINRKLYNQLQEKGYHFELTYSPAIEDSTKRKNLIHVSHFYHSVGKSRSIIFSSGANHHMLLRSPYDVINLGLIFGLSELQCKTAISENSRKTILNSVGRRHGKAVMFVENTNINEVEKNTKDVSRLSITEVLSSDDEDMKTDQPAFKKSKQ